MSRRVALCSARRAWRRTSISASMAPASAEPTSAAATSASTRCFRCCVSVVRLPLARCQQQMLAIGQALMRDPQLLMLDEPSLGLAPIIVDQVLDVVVQLRQEGATILLVEQMVERALEVADYGYVLQGGRVVAEGASASLAAGDAIRRAYLGAAAG